MQNCCMLKKKLKKYAVIFSLFLFCSFHFCDILRMTNTWHNYCKYSVTSREWTPSGHKKVFITRADWERKCNVLCIFLFS